MRYFRDGVLKMNYKKRYFPEMEVLFYIIIPDHFMAR